jgi:hypothetical protein
MLKQHGQQVVSLKDQGQKILQADSIQQKCLEKLPHNCKLMLIPVKHA